MRSGHGVFVTVMALFLVAFMGAAVFAADLGTPVKITNPAQGAGEADGIDPEGYMGVHSGDRWNSYIWSLGCMEDCQGDSYLWAGTNRNILYLVFYNYLFPTLKEAGFTIRDFDYALEKLFCGNVPTGWPGCENVIYPDKDFRAKIWRKNLTGDTEWEMVHQADTCSEFYMDEEETVKYIAGQDWGYRAATTYTTPGGDEALYFGTAASFCNPAWSVWRFSDDECCGSVVAEKVFEESASEGESSGLLDIKLSARAFAVYNDKLFVGTDNLAVYWDDVPDPDNIGQGGSPEWTAVAGPDDLGGEGALWDMASFDGYLYVFVSDPDGFRVYRGKEPAEECTSWTWECIVGPGGRYVQGMGRACNAAATPLVCGDYVYVGTFIDIFEVIQDVLAAGDVQAELLDGAEDDLDQAVSAARLQARSEGRTSDEVEEEVEEARGEVCGSRILLAVLRMHEALDQVCPAQVFRFSRDVCETEVEAVAYDGEDEIGDDCCSDAGDTWELVVGTPGDYNPYFGQAISDWGDGFGSRFNLYAWRMICCNDDVYITTFDSLSMFHGLTECWFDEEGNINHPFWSCLPEDLRNEVSCLVEELGAIVTDASGDNPIGFDMYRLSNPEAGTGEHLDITVATRDGFGDKYNYGGRTLACCDDCLYIGTANPFYGGQVWKMCPDEESETSVCTSCPTSATCSSSGIEVLIGMELEPEDSLYEGSGWFFQVNCTASDDIDPVGEIVFGFGDTCPESEDVVLFRWDATGLLWQPESETSLVWSEGPPCELTVSLDEPCGDTFAVVPADTTVDVMNGVTDSDGDTTASDTTDDSDGSSGCNVGFSAAALLFAVPLVNVLRKR